jgi:hypothetical protein
MLEYMKLSSGSVFDPMHFSSGCQDGILAWVLQSLSFLSLPTLKVKLHNMKIGLFYYKAVRDLLQKLQKTTGCDVFGNFHTSEQHYKL